MKKKINKKRTAIAALSAALVATLAIGGTLAFLTDTDTKTNKITVTSDLEVTVDEPEWPDPEPEFLPGDVHYKDPVIKTEKDVYARFKVEIVNQDGTAITDDDRLALIWKTIKYDTTFVPADPSASTDAASTALVPGTAYTETDITGIPTTNTDDFYAENQGQNVAYYYYKGGAAANPYILNAGETSSQLFTTIVIPSDWDNAATPLPAGKNGYISTIGKYSIKVTVQAIQAEYNTLPDTVTNDGTYADWFEDNYVEPAE